MEGFVLGIHTNELLLSEKKMTFQQKKSDSRNHILDAVRFKLFVWFSLSMKFLLSVFLQLLNPSNCRVS